MASIVLDSVTKKFENGFVAVNNFDLEIRDREFIILVGPSGCGKSTTLRMIAGLEEISSGELLIGGKKMNDTPPKNRDIAMVFQNYALYPHMTVYQNMAFALRQRKTPADEISKKVLAAAKSLQLEELLERKPRQLSGGQRQRVALGRAMVRDPSVFLLDEPLSNLDAKLRTEMRKTIKELHRRLGTTFVYVTHDQTEAMTMGDRIVVMKDGNILQADTPEELYLHPLTKFVAGFIGSPEMNFFTATLQSDGERLTLLSGDAEIKMPREYLADAVEKYEGKELILGLRPENISASETPLEESFKAKVKLIELMGSKKQIHFSFGGGDGVAIASAAFSGKEEDDVFLIPDMKKAHFFDAETEKIIHSGS